jgi:D-amino-acid oxidase
VEEIQFFDVWEDKEGGETPWFKDLVPGFKVLHDKKSNTQNVKIPGNFSKGIAFRSFITNAPNYLAWLSQECNKRGIPMVRHRLSALDQAYDLHGLGLSREKGRKVNLVINCSALGSRSLIGVEDESKPNSHRSASHRRLIRCFCSRISGQGSNSPRQSSRSKDLLHAF